MAISRRTTLLALTGACAWPAQHGIDAKADRPSAQQVMKELALGNQRFAHGRAKRPHTSLARIKDTAHNGQHPVALCLSCSDSRVPPEVLFDLGIGDIFTVRVAGNVANNDEIASLEYAAEHFNPPVCVVLGHYECGAVKAVVEGEKVPETIEKLVHHIAESVDITRKKHPHLKGEEFLAEAVRANVHETIDDLLRDSTIIGPKVREGKLKVVGAVYRLEDGKVEWLGA